MKKLLFICIVLCCFSTAGMAQFTSGLKAGVNLGTANIKDIQSEWESDGLAAGVHAGFFLRLGLGPIYVQPEAYYTFTQANLSKKAIATPQEIETFSLDFHRLDVPVLLGFRPFPLLRVNAGPFATVLFNTKAETQNSVLDQSLRSHSEDLYNRAGWGWQAGIGVDILKFTLDARYETTVGNLRDQDLNNITPSLSWLPNKQSQRQFVLSLGYKF